MSTKLSCCCGVWLVDNLHGSESTWRRTHWEQKDCFTKGLVRILQNKNYLEIRLTFLRNNESTPRYLDTMYRHRRWRSIPEPVMARRYMFWCFSAAFRNRASLWAFWPKTQTRVTSFCWCQFNSQNIRASRVQDTAIWWLWALVANQRTTFQSVNLLHAVSGYTPQMSLIGLEPQAHLNANVQSGHLRLDFLVLTNLPTQRTNHFVILQEPQKFTCCFVLMICSPMAALPSFGEAYGAWSCWAYCCISTLHGSDKRHGLGRAGSYRLCPPVSEHTGHWWLVGQTEQSLVLQRS